MEQILLNIIFILGFITTVSLALFFIVFIGTLLLMKYQDFWEK